MKRISLLIATCISCLSIISCSSVKNIQLKEAAEKAKIMAVIEGETDCFFARDYDCWQDKFTHSDYSYQAWSNSDGTFDASVGWDNIEKNLGKYIKENPSEEEDAGSSHPVIKRKNVMVKFYGDTAAHLTWDQYNSSRDQSYFLHSKEVRLMEKEDGQWKIVNVSAFWDYKNRIAWGDL